MIVMGLRRLELELGSKSNLLELGLGRGVSWSRYFFILQNTVLFLFFKAFAWFENESIGQVDNG